MLALLIFANFAILYPIEVYTFANQNLPESKEVPNKTIAISSVSEESVQIMHLYPELKIFEEPILSKIDGKQVLFYEIYVSNYSTLKPAKLEVLNENNKVIYSISGTLLNNTLLPLREWNGLTPIRMWVEINAIPKNISHKLYFENSALAVSGAPTSIIVKPLLHIQPPLRSLQNQPNMDNKSWLSANAPSNFEPHRNAIFELNGKYYVPQRYAIDWIISDENGNWGIGNGSLVTDHYCYGQDILAVADGTVVNLQDGMPDNKVGELPPKNIVLLGGNYMVLDLHNGYYAFYAHMIPGTQTVKMGDNVTAGQVIGKLGSSGNSDAPHLHFHICDSMDYLFCHGQPYAFDYILNNTRFNDSMPANFEEVSWN